MVQGLTPSPPLLMDMGSVPSRVGVGVVHGGPRKRHLGVKGGGPRTYVAYFLNWERKVDQQDIINILCFRRLVPIRSPFF